MPAQRERHPHIRTSPQVHNDPTPFAFQLPGMQLGNTPPCCDFQGFRKGSDSEPRPAAREKQQALGTTCEAFGTYCYDARMVTATVLAWWMDINIWRDHPIVIINCDQL